MLFKSLLLAAGLQVAAAEYLEQSYCSTKNTGSDYNAVTNIWGSLGSCHNNCNTTEATYKWAVVQYQKCWCTNDTPSDTIDVSKCDDSCPGYPYENCGSAANDYFGYVSVERYAVQSLPASVSLAAQTNASSTSYAKETSTSLNSTNSTHYASSTGYTNTSSASGAAHTGAAAGMGGARVGMAGTALVLGMVGFLLL
ncbi:hypothetical protein BDV97DRAFT_396622 [Delphinella strobiligena]|nr:hypothetical protein BDV97DRAFT_396622 [Delphinella strobiligena]